MSKTATALLVKFIMTFVFALLALSLLVDNNSWTWSFWVALLGTAVNYVVGDLLVLPKFGNIVATVGDGVMAALTAYIIDYLVPTAFQTSFTALILFGVLVAVGEYFFHQYLRRSEKVEP